VRGSTRRTWFTTDRAHRSRSSNVVHADASGEIIVAVNKSGDAGEEGGVGILLSPMAADSGPADATAD
jgi:hypothetical protein